MPANVWGTKGFDQAAVHKRSWKKALLLAAISTGFRGIGVFDNGN